nr:MAG TPA: minor structural protein [Herelleviridae sp.]
MELTDEHSLTNYRLYQNSVEILKERNKLNIQFETTLVGLIQNLPRDNKWNEWIVLGDFVNLEEENLMETGEGRIRIVGFTYVPKEHKITNISFSNRDKSLDELSKLSTIGEKINRSNTYTNNYKTIWKNSTSINDYVNKMLTDGLDMKAQSIKSRSANIKIDMSESGIFLINADNENNQLYLCDSMLAISNDRWLTAKCAIDENGIIGKQIIGEIILGHKLYITSENGEFYIGDMDENAGFGLSIKDSNDVQRVFLGTELENGVRKARLRLYGKDGKGLVLSEEGIVSEFQYTDRSAVDLNSPMYSYFRIKNNVNLLKECVIMIKLRPFRVYSKGMEGGGGYVQGASTLSGGGTTSSSNGGYSNTMTSSNQNYVNFQAEFTTNPQQEYSGNSHVHPISKFQFDHSHSVSISIGSHTHSCPNHSHTTNLNIPNHTHAEKYGCYDLGGTENIPSNVVLKVNGKIVRSNINSDTEVDITSYLTIGRVNEIILESSTRGQIYINLYSKSFVTW